MNLVVSLRGLLDKYSLMMSVNIFLLIQYLPTGAGPMTELFFYFRFSPGVELFEHYH